MGYATADVIVLNTVYAIHSHASNYSVDMPFDGALGQMITGSLPSQLTERVLGADLAKRTTETTR